MDKRISDAIASSRFILCLLVLVIHSRQIYNENISNWVTISIDYSANFLCSVAVPAFMCFSSFILFSRYINDDNTLILYKSNIVKKIHRLFIPYILWNIIAVGIIFVKSLFKEIYIPSIIESFWAMPDRFLFPADGPLWFIRDLIIFNLISPVFFLFKFIPFGIYIGFGICLYLIYFNPLPLFITFSTSIQWFMLGAIMGMMKFELKSINKYRYIIFAISFFSLLMGLYCQIYDYDIVYIKRVYIFFGILSLLFLKRNNTFIEWGRHNFFVYASHIFIIGYVLKINNILFNSIFNQNLSTLISFIITPIFTFILISLIAIFLNKYCKRVYNFLIGIK